ncbi:quinone oxidoreductase family protein [Paraliomyxa miuraensis]|uniref:quinone oxidoreductase family protein n=1 Tax=Paraliomyxa miuraensis TaxID=376150 RepID=UPI002252BDCF|nr:quinone oxidoreductase [Paraliomyxa miuraensis]MCX4245023.1 quinone oxidoreductase [Paraliomyxa miuraensis]
MKSTVIQLHAHGGPEVLQARELALAPPASGQARVRHTAIGVNFIDTYHRTGLYPVELPSGLGMEAAGVVEEVGPDVDEVVVGQRVAYAAGPPGAYATHRNVRAAVLVPLPDGVSDEVAAAALLKGMTVEFLVRRTFPVEPGMTVLWHAAAGGVGLIACQWLAHLGVTVIGTVGSDDKAELARAHGCTHPIVYTRDAFEARVLELTGGQGVPVAYDSVGRATFDGSLRCLRRRGMLVGFGNASGKPDPFDIGRLAQHGSLFLTRPMLFDYVATREELLASAGALFSVLESGAVKVEVRQRWPLVEAEAAHRALEDRRTQGSTVLIP